MYKREVHILVYDEDKVGDMVYYKEFILDSDDELNDFNAEFGDSIERLDSDMRLWYNLKDEK